MVTLSLNRGQARTWHVKAATFVLWLLAAGVVAFWAMRLGNGGAGAPVPPAPAEPLQVDAPALAQALGGVAAAQGAVAPAAAPVVSRYALVGVLAGRDSGGGAAVIAVGNQPAKPFRVGRAVEDGVVLQSVSGREAPPGAQGRWPGFHHAADSPARQALIPVSAATAGPAPASRQSQARAASIGPPGAGRCLRASAIARSAPRRHG